MEFYPGVVIESIPPTCYMGSWVSIIDPYLTDLMARKNPWLILFKFIKESGGMI